MSNKKRWLILSSVLLGLATFSVARAVPNFTTGLNVSGGNVGIGNTSPSVRLDVSGGGNAYGTNIYGLWTPDGNSLVRNWALNDGSNNYIRVSGNSGVYTSISDSPLGSKTMRWSAPGYLRNEQWIPVDITKTYKVSVWGRTISGTPNNYLSLTQAASDLSQPVNGGWGNPYWGVVNQPFPTTWTYYSMTIGPSGSGANYTWNATTKYVQLGALMIYTGSGVCELTGYKIEELTNTIAAGASALGSLNVVGTLTAGTLSGSYSGTLTAGNVSSGAFGSNTGGGNYSFSGNVGVGTDSPAAPLNLYKAPTSGFVEQLRIGGTGNYRSLDLGTYGAYGGYISTYGNDLYILSGRGVTTENHNIHFYTSFIGAGGAAENNERMTILYSGNVGIGTASPVQKLDVNGILKLGSATNVLLGLSANVANRASLTLNSTSGNPADIVFKNGSVTTGNFGQWAISARNGSNDYRFSIWRGGENGGVGSELEVFSIAPSGNIGIGTTGPGYKLDVIGNGAFRSGDNSYLYFGPNGSWGGSLYVGATPSKISNNVAQVISTDGNLHLDSGLNNNMYLNFYSGRQVLVYGPMTSNSSITAASFSGALSGTLNAANVSAGTFGGNTGGGSFKFPGNIYTDANYGYGLVGVYTSTRYQGVYSMGDAYKLPADGSTTGNLYGLAWSHPNAGGVASNLNTHGLLVMENGTFLAAVSGSIRARDDMRAPILAVTNGSSWTTSGQAQNIKLKGASGTDVGITAYNSSNVWIWQLYGAGSQYGFLNANWGGWDMQKTIGGALVLNGSQTVIHSGNIGSQSVNYATSAGSATNATNATVVNRLRETGGYDANAMSGGGAISNYGSTGYWVNAPAGLSYGAIYQLNSRAADSLAVQLAIDINHNDVNSTRDLWFRSSNNLGWQNDWKRVIHSGNIGSQSVNYATSAGSATSAGNADTVDGYHGTSLVPKDAWWGSTYHGSDGNIYLGWRSQWLSDALNGKSDSGHGHTGYMDIAANRLYDHYTGGAMYAYNGRLYNGWLGDSVSVNYANSAGSASSASSATSAGNADTVDGWHRDDLRAWGNLTGIPAHISGMNQWVNTTSDVQFNNVAVSNTVSATTFSYNSDRNFKQNITTISNPIEKIMNLRGVTFNWKKDNKESVGLIAQEVEKVFPELVSGEEGSKSVQYGNLVAPLIEAVKAQQKEIERLEMRIKMLEDKE